MIQVFPTQEASDFDEKVRQPGLSFLESEGISKGMEVPSEFPWKTLWTKCLEDLYDNHDGICAYTGAYFEYSDGAGTVDHFFPKKHFPLEAYEWDNYRLATRQRNSYKGDFDDVLDPFLVRNGWFQIDFVTGSVIPNPEIDEVTKKQVIASRNRLRLNDLRLRQRRVDWFSEVESGVKTMADAKRYYPFVYEELIRQGFRF